MATDYQPRSSVFSCTIVANVILLLFFSNAADSSDVLHCFSEKFSSTEKWNVTIHIQEELDSFVDNVTSFNSKNMDRCIQLLLTGKNYKLDITEMMKIKVGTGGGLVIVGLTSPRVKINCVSSVSRLKELRNILKPLSNVLLVVLDGLQFTGCPVPVVLEEVSTVIVQNCDFVNHEHGALNIFNSPNVIVKHCTFCNNTSSSYFTRKPFQGNSGGLSVAYNTKLASLSSINVLVINCIFINNSADPPSFLFLTTTDLIEKQIFSGRGGAMAMPIKADCPLNITVNNSLFMNNFAQNYGGSTYYFIGGRNSNQTYMFGNNSYIGNRALIGSGAMHFGNFGKTMPFTSLHSTIYNCIFANNKAQSGGCSHMFPSYSGYSGNSFKIENCSFYNNTATKIGGTYDISSYNSYKSRQHYDPVQFIDCKFDGNFGGKGATIDLSFYNGAFENVIFNNNRGPVIRAIGAAIKINGNVSFTNNNAEGFDGGALYMLTSSQITLNPGAHLDFVNNTGGLGASIVVVAGTVLPVFARNRHNPLCFIQYPHPDVPPVQWEQVSMGFTGNKAIIGSAIYTNTLDLCSWYSFGPPYFYTNRSDVLRWPFVSYGQGDEFNPNINSGHSEQNSSIQLLAVQTPATNFTVNTKAIAAYPGEDIQVSLSPYDEQDYLTSENFRISTNLDKNLKNALLDFNPTAQTINPSDLTFSVKYTIKDAIEITNDMLKKNYSIEVSTLTTKSVLVQDDMKQLNLTIKPCPPGHVLHVTGSREKYECRCDDTDVNIVECTPNENKITLEAGLWAQYVNNGSVNSILEYYHCPPGYCQCRRLDKSLQKCSSVYSYSDENFQCVCDRQGFLCGKCQGNKGISVLLNNCKSCGEANLLLILALVVADIFLIATILIVTTTIPLWLFPLLFYLQVIPIVAQDFPAPFGIVKAYLQYISSATGLYFPYDFCLYSGMTAVVSYSFRYIPFLLSVIVSTILYSINRKYGFGKNLRLSWNGLWLLLLLLYTDIVNTSVSILNCPILSDSSGKKTPRWYVDGTVECYIKEHLPLAAVAILMLLFCVFVILFMAAAVKRKIKRHWAFSLSNILRIPFTDRLYWWAPVDLLRRLLFIILVIILPGNLAPVLLLTMVYVAVFAYLKPYRSFYINVLEVFTLIDMMLQLMIASTQQLKDPILRTEGDFRNLTDDCGKIKNLSEHATMLVPFYYFPLLIIIILTVKLIGTRIYANLINWYYKNKNVAMNYSVNTELLDATEPIMTSYMEFDENNKNFKIISGSTIKSESYGRVSHDF